MLFTLAAVIFFAAIFVFFSQEFIRIFKRIFAIKGAKTIIPLAIASWLAYTFSDWVLWFVFYYREVLLAMQDFLTRLLPFGNAASSVSVIAVLTLVSILPVFVTELILKHRTYRSYQYPYLTSTIIWWLSVVALIILKN